MEACDLGKGFTRKGLSQEVQLLMMSNAGMMEERQLFSHQRRKMLR